MIKTSSFVLLVLTLLVALAARGQESENHCLRYKSLTCPQPSKKSTWAILKRDGANREVAPYLSSLGQGESGTGVVSSPPFTITSDMITFTRSRGKNPQHTFTPQDTLTCDTHVPH